jgi:hypothetical protein
MDKAVSRIRHIAATLCYGFAWLSMVALIAMVAVAELLQGEATAVADASHADALARLHVARRVPR